MGNVQQTAMASVPTRHRAIFSLLKDRELPEAEVLDLLESIIKEDPDSVFARDCDGRTPLHYASIHRSFNVCKMLVEADPSLRTVRATDDFDCLPFHEAILERNLETVKYLFELNPESINAPDMGGNYLMRRVLSNLDIQPPAKFEAANETIKFLLEHYQSAVYTADRFGMLPLHHASKHKFTLPIVKQLFDAYPGAIHIRNRRGETPLELARLNNLSEAVSFLEYQLNSAQQLSLREALSDSDVSLGCIKLMIETSPQSLREVDSQGQLPVHIACNFCDISVVEFLVDAYPCSLQIRDENNNLPLHIACREGKFDAINFILERSDHGVDSVGGDGMYPINLLLLCADCDRNSLEYVDSVGRLLRMNPASLMTNMMW